MRNIRFLSVMDRMMMSDLLKTIFSVLAVLVIIIVSRNFIKILKMAVDGLISNEAIMSILGLKIILASTDFIPPAVFVGVLMVMGRMYRDQEMSALASAGVGVGRIYIAVFKVIVPVTIFAVWMSLYVSPWAAYKVENIIHEQKKNAGIRAISEGKFSEYSQGEWIFYAERISSDNRMHEVFVHNREENESAIISAESAEIRDINGDLYIVFMDGERVQGEIGQLEFVLEAFDEYGFRLEVSSDAMVSQVEGLTTERLFYARNLVEVRELHQRLSVPIGMIVLAIMAVPLAQMSPRGGAYGNMVTAFLIYFSFSNFEKVSGSWMVKGDIPAWLGFWGTYLLACVIICVLLIRLYGLAWVIMCLRRQTL